MNFGGAAATGWAFTANAIYLHEESDLVMISVDMKVTAVGSATGALTIANAPYTAWGGPGMANVFGGSATFANALNTGVGTSPIEVIINGVILYFSKQSNGSTVPVTNSDLAVNSQIRFTFSYPSVN